MIMNAISILADNTPVFATSLVGVYTAGVLSIVSVAVGIVFKNMLSERARNHEETKLRDERLHNLEVWFQWTSAQVWQIQKSLGIETPVNPFVHGGHDDGH